MTDYYLSEDHAEVKQLNTAIVERIANILCFAIIVVIIMLLRIIS